MPADMKRVHEDALKSGMPAFHEFMQAYRGSAREVYAFVEGKDDPLFYRGFIEGIIDPSWRVRFISAGGKRAVREAYADMDWERFSKQRVCFFVDRDLSDFTGDVIQAAPNMYVTDMYSIENEVLNSQALLRVLSEVFDVNLNHEDEEKIVNLYFDNLLEFTERMVPLTAQIVLWRMGGDDSYRPNLKNLKMNSLFCFKDSKLSLVDTEGGMQSFLSLCSAQVQCPLHGQQERAAVEVMLRAVYPPYRTVRGKYVFWFFSVSVIDIHSNIHLLTGSFQAPPKPRYTFNSGTALGLVAPRLRAPDSLRTFVASNFCAYISSVADATPAAGAMH
jgi:hypothetical protein